MAIRPRSQASRPRILVVAGPTASGKTDIALELAKHLPVETISCDSMQVYKGMPILTQAAGSVHLSQFLSPLQEYNASRFARDASKRITAILKKDRVPLITAGTGLYLRALLDGLFEHGGKTRDEKLRRRLKRAEKDRGPGTLHARLQKCDPASASRIHPNDLFRVVRALEVFELTGRPMSELQPKRSGIRQRYDVRVFFVDRPRPELYARIDARAGRMLRQGLRAEVGRVRKKRLSRTASAALGFKEIGAELDGTLSRAEAFELLKRNTRRYAKRQIAWFKHEKGVDTLSAAPGESPKSLAGRILEAWNARS